MRLVSIPIRRQCASVREPYTVRPRRIQYDDLDAQVYWVAILCEHLLILAEHPERAIEFAIKGMLPKGPLGRRMYKKLHVFGGSEHPHQAQQPKVLAF